MKLRNSTYPPTARFYPRSLQHFSPLLALCVVLKDHLTPSTFMPGFLPWRLALASAPFTLFLHLNSFLVPSPLHCHHTCVQSSAFSRLHTSPKREQIQHLFLKVPFRGGNAKNLVIFVKLAGKKKAKKPKKTTQKIPTPQKTTNEKKTQKKTLLYYKALACLSHCTSAKCISKS